MTNIRNNEIIVTPHSLELIKFFLNNAHYSYTNIHFSKSMHDHIRARILISQILINSCNMHIYFSSVSESSIKHIVHEFNFVIVLNRFISFKNCICTINGTRAYVNWMNK